MLRDGQKCRSARQCKKEFNKHPTLVIKLVVFVFRNASNTLELDSCFLINHIRMYVALQTTACSGMDGWLPLGGLR